ncbi:outer membrane lipoprotein-sorting protein [Candidatus Latescibacterota bacterium]
MKSAIAVKRIIFGYFIVIMITVSVSITCEAEELDAQALIRQVETQYQGETSHATMRMRIVTDAWSREVTMESWSEGREKFLAKILSPKKDEGTATLKIGDDMWNYLPKIDRLMKIPSSLMGDRWMGSHLTNDDLVKENKIDELYTFMVENVEDTVATIICIPKPDAAIVWDKVVYSVDLDKKVPVEIDYYDEDGELVRIMTFDSVKKVSCRWIPLRMKIQPVEYPDEMTEITYENIKFDVQFDENQFSLSSLRRR